MATALILHGYNEEHLVWPVLSVEEGRSVMVEFEYDISDAEIVEDGVVAEAYTKFEGRLQQCSILQPIKEINHE